MGCIYIIKNKINNMVYIGQTRFDEKHRYKQHIYACKYNANKNKLYSAMYSIGVNNFYVEKLCDVDNNSNLSTLEDYYIHKYDSIKNGYNSSIVGGKAYKDVDIDLDALIVDFLAGTQMTDLVAKYKRSSRYLYDILRYMDISRSNTVENRPEGNRKPIIMCDEHTFEHIKYFDSKIEAYNWIVNNTKYIAHKGHVYMYLKRSCICGNIAYGYRWQLLEQLVYEDKVFRTIFDIQGYKNGYKISKDSKNNYWIAEGVISSIITKSDLKSRCRLCGDIIKYDGTLCDRCKQIKEEEKEIKINNIRNLIELGYTYEHIGRIYGVSGKAISKMCIKQNITSPKSII